MTPDYALSLSFSGIALLARASLSGGPEDAWYSLGEVALDVDDLAGALAVLREEATATPDMDGPEVKLILPEDQIKYLSVPQDARDAVVQAEDALHGATPYAVDELLFDWHAAEDMLHIAAVARETLTEAETFARDHGFLPISFVAMPSSDLFEREPFFGAAQSAAAQLPPGEAVRPEVQKVRVIPGAPPSRGPIAVERDAPNIDPALADPPPQSAAPTENPASQTPVSDPAGTDATQDHAATSDVRDDGQDSRIAIEAPTDGDAPTTPPPGVGLASPQDVPEAVKPVSAAQRGAPAEQSVAFSSLRAERKGRAAAPEPRATPDAAPRASLNPLAEGTPPPLARGDDVDNTSASNPVRVAAPSPSEDQDDAPHPTFAEAIKARAQESLRDRYSDDAARRPAPMGASEAGTAFRNGVTSEQATQSSRPASRATQENQRSVGSVLARAQSGLGRGIGFISRRQSYSNAPSEAAKVPSNVGPSATGGATAALTAENKMDEAERMTVFGARRHVKNGGVGGKPRFLGLMLTTALLLFLLGVAAWASVFIEDRFARFFKSDGDAAQIETALSEPRPSQSPQDTAEPEMDVPVEAVSLALPDDNVAAPTSLAPSSPETSQQLAALSPGIPSSPTPLLPEPDGFVRAIGSDALSPEEAEARYAATGIWQRSPLPPAELRQGLLDDLTVASLDQTLDTPAVPFLSQPQMFATDLAPPVQNLPPRADQRYAFDPRGFIRPSAEGVVTPDGYTLILGRPSILPPASRLGLAEPTPPDIATPRAPSEEEPTGEAVALAGIEEDGQDDTGDAQRAPFFADPALAGFRPLARPSGLAPLDVLPSGTEDADASVPEAETIIVSALAGFRPTARPAEFAARFAPVEPPSNVAPTTDAESDGSVEIATPEEPEAPISQLAVVRSLSPELRPRNMRAIVRRTEDAAPQEAPPATQVAAVAPRTVQPAAPSRQSVATAATQNNVINLRRVNLIGVYGKPSDRRALVRLANGRFQKVKVGDRLDGGRILAISDDALRYQKSGRNVTLNLPQG